jgi:hypothetical protein
MNHDVRFWLFLQVAKAALRPAMVSSRETSENRAAVVFVLRGPTLERSLSYVK